MVIAASEDIGNADPNGLILAQSAADATEFIGLPECRIPLAQAVTYLALAAKSNASYVAIDAAMEDVRTQRLLPVPVHLRDRHYAGAARTGPRRRLSISPRRRRGLDRPRIPRHDERHFYEPVDRGLKRCKLKQKLDDYRQPRQKEHAVIPSRHGNTRRYLCQILLRYTPYTV